MGVFVPKGKKMHKINWQEMISLPKYTVGRLQLDGKWYYFVKNSLSEKIELTSTPLALYLNFLSPTLVLELAQSGGLPNNYQNGVFAGSVIDSDTGLLVCIGKLVELNEDTQFEVFEPKDFSTLLFTAADLFSGYDGLDQSGYKDMQTKAGKALFGMIF